MRMKTIVASVFPLMLIANLALASDTDELIKLDKAWGSAEPGAVGSFLSDDVLAMSSEGVGDKAAMVKAAAEAGPATGPYVAGDYVVHFLSPDIAVMTHSAGGDNPHLSMHVWQKTKGKWLVAATATVPAE